MELNLAQSVDLVASLDFGYQTLLVVEVPLHNAVVAAADSHHSRNYNNYYGTVPDTCR